MSDAERPKRRALGRGITDAIDSPEATATTSLLNKVKPRSLVLDQSGTRVPEFEQVALPEQFTGKSTLVPDPSSTLVPKSHFYRKPNATVDKIDRQLTPAESKVYDHLLRLTVGFNRDRCQIRVSVLCDRTGYRSMKTVRIALFGLESKTLIRKVSRNNDPLGDEYVMLESGTRVLDHSSTLVENSQVLESKVTRQLKKNIKEQNTDDDAALALMARFQQMEREVTGKTGHIDKWEEVLDLLFTELQIAATRTTSISNVPAFLAEHLRRRLWKKDKQQLSREGCSEAASSPPAAPNVGTSQCPDCGGSGMYYPDGYEKGVAKCRHEQLTKTSE